MDLQGVGGEKGLAAVVTLVLTLVWVSPNIDSVVWEGLKTKTTLRPSLINRKLYSMVSGSIQALPCSPQCESSGGS